MAPGRNVLRELAEVRARLGDVERLMVEYAQFRTSVCVQAERFGEQCLQAAASMRDLEERIRARVRGKK